MNERRQESYAVRLEAAELARSREYPDHKANGDEQKYAGDKYFMSFTKGLPHDSETGLLHDPLDFVEFRRAIDDGFIDPFSDRVRHGAKYEVDKTTNQIQKVSNPPNDFRQWEAPTAGVVFELQGPDAQAVTMPSAPPLIGVDGEANPELVLEMAEIYELAILRDKPFNAFECGGGDNDINNSIKRLNALPYISNQTGRPRKVDSGSKLNLQTVFRGSSPGVEIGPYLSQFLLIGNTDLNGGGRVGEGKITYGVLQIEQKVPVAKPGTDYMTDIDEYVCVQRGLKRDLEAYEPDPNSKSGRPARRFISTPRDLATYVHYDALYEAYLNACIILLGMKTPFDPGFDHLSGVGVAAASPATRRNAGGFALYGGPHILNLVTEVATRALKAVRFQKFNNHIRLRPEALAARIELLREPSGKDIPPALSRDIGELKKALESNQVNCGQSTLDVIKNGVGNGTHFLPMAFPEGSPMHPAYGAGHATVAGACVTILKAFFDTSAVLGKKDDKVAFKRFENGDTPIAFRAPNIPKDKIVPNQWELDDTKLPVPSEPKQFLTLEGELNKLAANISIGRNMAGVHYFSDYYDSLRMGEEIAIGILEEQALTYSTDPFVLSVPTFDGDVVRIGRR
ncbi:MAG: vanadium-dependent haloperoxidase [Xenococcaceae cyanobacterium MO_234.B1]|nr:vanadium-dependent haloperoxidase [Xenococcaceae cyanobacterium MO_234.B1]